MAVSMPPSRRSLLRLGSIRSGRSQDHRDRVGRYRTVKEWRLDALGATAHGPSTCVPAETEESMQLWN